MTVLRVTVWNEHRHERNQEQVRGLYPDGIHGTLAAALREDPALGVRTATLDEDEHGLTAEVLAETDVLVWWGHEAHDEVADEVVDRVQERVLAGMGLLALHSSHFSKIFRRLMGTSGSLQWRKPDRERVWVVDPAHPVAAGLPASFELQVEEMYGEPFDIPRPEELVLVSWFAGGEVFRSGCAWRRGRGRVFYFRPGDEEYPTYHDPHVRRVVRNAVRWLGFRATEPG